MRPPRALPAAYFDRNERYAYFGDRTPVYRNPNLDVAPSGLDIETFAVSLEKARVPHRFVTRGWQPVRRQKSNVRSQNSEPGTSPPGRVWTTVEQSPGGRPIHRRSERVLIYGRQRLRGDRTPRRRKGRRQKTEDRRQKTEP